MKKLTVFFFLVMLSACKDGPISQPISDSTLDTSSDNKKSASIEPIEVSISGGSYLRYQEPKNYSQSMVPIKKGRFGLSIQGGVSPYKAEVIAGPAFITYGDYEGFKLNPNNKLGDVVILVTDSKGNQSYRVVKLYDPEIKISIDGDKQDRLFLTKYMNKFQESAISAEGGVPPYSYSLASKKTHTRYRFDKKSPKNKSTYDGNATIDSSTGLLKIGSTAEDFQVVVKDSLGNVEFIDVSARHFERTQDFSFGKKGLAKVDYGKSQLGVRWAFTQKFINVNSDDSIIVSGERWTLSSHTNPKDEADAILYKLTPNGALDQSFGSDGFAIIDSNIAEKGNFPGVKINSVKTLINGDILVLFSKEEHGKRTTFELKKFNANGMVDSSFGNQGVISLDGHGLSGYRSIGSIMLNESGIYVTASRYSSELEESDYVVLKLNHDGTISTSFGNKGIVVLPLELESDNSLSLVKVGNESKALVVGSKNINPDQKDEELKRALPENERVAVFMFDLLTGKEDTQFGDSGLALYDFVDVRKIHISRFANVQSGIAATQLSDGNFLMTGYVLGSSFVAVFDRNGEMKQDPFGNKYRPSDYYIFLSAIETPSRVSMGHFDMQYARFSNLSDGRVLLSIDRNDSGRSYSEKRSIFFVIDKEKDSENWKISTYNFKAEVRAYDSPNARIVNWDASLKGGIIAFQSDGKAISFSEDDSVIRFWEEK